MVVVVDERTVLLLKGAQHVVALELNDVFHGSVIPLDLALSNRMIGLASCVFDIPAIKVILHVSGDIAGAGVSPWELTCPT